LDAAGQRFVFSQTRTKLIPGDSGGGLWFNGYLVGDLWAREEASENDWSQWSWQDFKPGVKVLESAYAAQLTLE
jgi:hypothetical protein